MKFGYFDDEAREYVITTPRTPLPWINYLGSQDFFSLISNTGGGYSFYKDAKLLRITRYRYNDIPTENITISMITEPSGTRDSCHPARSWIPTNADMEWDIPVSKAVRTGLVQSFWLSYL